MTARLAKLLLGASLYGFIFWGDSALAATCSAPDTSNSPYVTGSAIGATTDELTHGVINLAVILNPERNLGGHKFDVGFECTTPKLNWEVRGNLGFNRQNGLLTPEILIIKIDSYMHMSVPHPPGENPNNNAIAQTTPFVPFSLSVSAKAVSEGIVPSKYKFFLTKPAHKYGSHPDVFEATYTLGTIGAFTSGPSFTSVAINFEARHRECASGGKSSSAATSEGSATTSKGCVLAPVPLPGAISYGITYVVFMISMVMFTRSKAALPAALLRRVFGRKSVSGC